VNVWNESERAPALALGYLSQGYGPHGPSSAAVQGTQVPSSDPRNQFADGEGPGSAYNLYFSKPRGFYLVASKETTRGAILDWTAGVNVVRFQPYRFSHDFGLFAGVAAGLTPDLHVALEYDDALNPRGGNLSFSVSYHMGSGWRIEPVAKNIAKPYAGRLRSPPGGNPVLSRMVKLDVLTGF
jgi:hypothetical protein